MKIISFTSGFMLVLFIFVFLIGTIYQLASPHPKVSFGVTFSPEYAKMLGLDWKNTYIKILDDLKVKNLRLTANWDEIEPAAGKEDFSNTDYMLSEASKHGAKVILVLGERQPRWPECHIPAWAQSLSASERRRKLLDFIGAVVKRYRDNPAVWAWQVENEPFLTSFGRGCDIPDKNFLQSEANLVRSLSYKPIIMTDSGELGSWILPMQLSDIFGTTLYRDVYNHVLGYVTYPLPPVFYNLKSHFIKYLFAPKNQKTIIVELQAEPWSADNDLLDTPVKSQAKLLPVQKFKDNISFARQTHFSEDFLWGVEWWYFMAKNGHPEYLNFAGTLFR